MKNKFKKDSSNALLNLNDVKRNGKLHKLIRKLNSPIYHTQEWDEDSVLCNGIVCGCKSSMLCHHRLQYIIDYLTKE